jgi:hypothetical protein
VVSVKKEREKEVRRETKGVEERERGRGKLRLGVSG